MAKIKIYGDIDSASIFFLNSTVDPKPMGTVVASLKSDEDRIVIQRNDRFEADGVTFRTLFRRLNPRRVCDRQGQELVDQLGYTTQQVIDYINAQANLTGVTGGDSTGADLIGQDVCFKLDATSTSIMIDNGFAFGVNTIKAVANANGNIDIKSEQADRTHFSNLEVGRVCGQDGVMIPGGITDVVNYLNELFTVGAFEQIVITDPEATTIADVGGLVDLGTTPGANSIDPLGDDILGTAATHNNAAGYLSDNIIDQAGEYFTFDIAGKATYGFGLVHTQDSYDDGYYKGNAAYADPSGFCVGPNSSHYGYQFAHHFHIGNTHASWTNYGADTSYVMGEAWYDHNNSFDMKEDWNNGDPVKMKVGIDTSGFIIISSKSDVAGEWRLHARSAYPVEEGSSFRLGVKLQSTGARLRTQPKVHLLEPAAPIMYFRFIESPDGYYSYPLFATEEEANYYEEIAGNGTPASHTHVYVDDPTNTTWYMPNTAHQMNYGLTPVEDGVTTFDGNPITWTEITSLSNADLVPSAYPDTTITVDELSSVNIQTQPQDVGYTTSFSLLPVGLIGFAGSINGTAPEVTGDNVANPSDSFIITVTRTNNYGSSTGTLTIVVNNLTAPIITPITGVTHIGGTPMIDSDTMDDGSVISIDNVVDNRNRFVIDKEWLDNYVLPKITSGTGSKAVIVGFAYDNADWNTATVSDFILCYQFYCNDTSRAQNSWRLRASIGGANNYDVGIGGLASGLYDYVFVNYGGTVQEGALVASQGFDASTKLFDVNGSDWNWALEQAGLPIESKDIVIATNGTTLDLDLQYFNEYSTPLPANHYQVADTGSNTYEFNGGSFPALQAGYTYTFPMNDVIWAGGTPSGLSSDDQIKFTADGSTEYTSGITVVGTSGASGADAYVQFVIPSDVPPLSWYTDAIGIGNANNISISGSTYVATVTGVAIEGPSANFTGNVINSLSSGWISLNESLSAGERLILDSTFIESLNNNLPDYCIFWVGLKGDNWTNTTTPTSAFKGLTALRFYNTGGSETGLRMMGYANGGTSNQIYSASLANASAFLEITSSGNNIRVGYEASSTYDAATTTYADWDGNSKIQTGDQGYGISSLDVVIYWQAITSNTVGFDISSMDWTQLSEINVPAPAVTNLTPWTKALDFSGSSERVQQVSSNSNYMPIAMDGLSATVSAPSVSGNTSGHAYSRPWATAIVFKADGNNSNQHIWNQGEGASSTNDNIYVRLSSNGGLYFGWGRDGALNECYIGSIFNQIQNDEWIGLYIAHNGTRYSGSNATASNLLSAFDIRLFGESTAYYSGNTGVWTPGSNISNQWGSNLSTTGARMDRNVVGNFTIGGRGSNRNFHGKVASFVSTTLRINQPMPTDAEIKMMVTDPVKWLQDYKVGNLYRVASSQAEATFQLFPYLSNAAFATQVWLMGDGSLDNYSNMIRNIVYSNDQNYTKLNMLSMVSNDIENVNIPGLS